MRLKPTIKNNSSAFSLVELLLVISILTVLVSLLMPSLNGMRERVKSSVCVSNLRQIGMGLMAYSGDYNGYFPPASTSDPLGTSFPQKETWGYFAWSYFGLGDPKVTFIKKVNDLRYDIKPGAKPNIFVCPKTRSKLVHVAGANTWGSHCYAMTSESGKVGGSSLFPINRAWVRNQSQAALIVENASLTTNCGGFFNYYGLVPHGQGMNVLFYDAHVEWVAENNIPITKKNKFWNGNYK